MSIYPVSITGDSGTVEVTGELEYIDPDNQPLSNASPFKCAPGEDVNVAVDSSDTPLIYAGEDTGGAVITDGSSRIVRVDADGVQVATDKLGFFLASPVVQPTIPATSPTADDIAAALVALGLVSAVE